VQAWARPPAAGLDSAFPVCSVAEDLAFKIVKLEAGQTEVIARIDNFTICKAAFEKALFVYPKDHLEMCKATARADSF
jgi:hypothetical protein